MSDYGCIRVEDAAGYVLRAMPDNEWEGYQYHVAECEHCAAKVAELGFVSHALLSAVPQLTAPPAIRSRVMSVVRAESELLLAAGAGADRPPARTGWGQRFGFGRLGPLTAGALAGVLIAVGLGVGTLLGAGSGATRCTTHRASEAPAGTTAKVEVCDGNARLALAGLARPPAGRIYELWLDDPRDAAGPKPAGLFSVRNGKASVDIGTLHGHETVLVTHESLPDGSATPTMAPIVTAST